MWVTVNPVRILRPLIDRDRCNVPLSPSAQIKIKIMDR